MKIIVKFANICVVSVVKSGDVKVSTGAQQPDKRVAVCQVCVKNGTLKINAKNNKTYALAA